MVDDEDHREGVKGGRGAVMRQSPGGRRAPGCGHDTDDEAKRNQRSFRAGSGRIGAGTHVGVELPHEAAEVCVREVLRHHVRGEPVHVVDGELLAVVGPGDDIPISLLLHEHVPAGCDRSGRESEAKVGGMATGFVWGFVSFFLSPEEWKPDSQFAQEAGRQAEVPRGEVRRVDRSHDPGV